MTPERREFLQMIRDQSKDDRALPPDTSLPEPEVAKDEPEEDKEPRCPDCGQRGERHVRLCGYD